MSPRTPTQGLADTRRRERLAALLLFAWGVVLCFVPLLNLLAFEFAFFTALPVTLLSGWLGARTVAGPSAGGAAPAPLARALGRTLLAAGAPLVPISLNALRVRNCNFPVGLAFYLLLPGLTAVIAWLWGRACATVAPRFGYRLFLGVVAASVAAALVHFWTAPPVDAFHWFVGYFPGSLYDEVIPLTGRLAGSRAADLAYAAGALLLARPGARRRLTGALLAAAAWGAGDLLELHRGAAHIQAALGGLRESPHFRLHHPASLDPAAVDRLMTELEFRHEELTTFFGKAPAAPVDVWIYEDEAQKKRLMGAGDVRIAKPWQRAVHLQLPDVGDGVLAHELAHAFSAEIAPAPHHLSLTPLFVPNMGVIEGTAVAAAWDDAPLDAHQWSQAMRTLGLGGELTELLSPHGFLTANSRAAYTQCGSFVRWLRDADGPAAVEALYRRGRLPPDSAEVTVAAWERFLDTQRLGPDALAIARVRFDRPAIFRKVCAHEIAALRDRAEALAAVDPAAALAVVDEILGHLPDDPDVLLVRIGLLYRQAEPARRAEAAELAAALAEREELGVVRRARAREWQADLLAGQGRPADRPRVQAMYQALLADSFDRAWTRRIAVKRAAAEADGWGPPVLALLTRPDDGGPAAAPAALDLLALARDQAPDHPVVRYLLGRQAARARRCDDAVVDTRAALARGLPHPALTLEAARLVAACHFEQGRYAEAAADFDALAARSDLGLLSGEVNGLATWARRARFFAAHPARDGEDRRD